VGRRRVITRAGRELALAFAHGECAGSGAGVARRGDFYVIVEAAAEAVLVVTPRSREEAVRIAFEVGNRHFALAVDAGRVLVPDDPAMEQLMRRLGGGVRADASGLRAAGVRASP